MEKAFYKIPEVAEVIGLGKSMTYKLVADGLIPSVRLAGTKTRRVSREALQQWIKEQSLVCGERGDGLENDGS